MVKYKTFLPLILALLGLLLFSYFLQGAVLQNKEEVTRWLSSFGPYVILVYVILQAITTIIAPLGGFFLVIIMISLFGPALALGLAYLVTTPCYLINFSLAKKFGRPFVEKVIGINSLQKLDHYTKDAGTPILILSRLLGGGNFDYLSYAWGLTRIPFKTFVLVNIFGGIPATVINYLVVTRFSSLTLGIVALYLISVVLAALAIYLTHFFKKHKI